MILLQYFIDQLFSIMLLKYLTNLKVKVLTSSLKRQRVDNTLTLHLDNCITSRMLHHLVAPL